MVCYAVPLKAMRAPWWPPLPRAACYAPNYHVPITSISTPKFLKMRAMQKNTCKMHTTNKSPQLRTDPRSPLGRRAISTYLLLYQPFIVLAVHEHVHSRSQCYLQDSPQCVILCPPTTLVRGFCRAPKLLRMQSLMCQHTRCKLLCRVTAKTQVSEVHRQMYQRYSVTQVSPEQSQSLGVVRGPGPGTAPQYF